MSAYSLPAQIKHFYDTIRYDLRQGETKKFFVSLDGKNNIIGDQNIKMFGIQGCFIYNSRTSIYSGIYWTYNSPQKIISNPTATSPATDTNTIFSSFGMNYINLGLEYEFYDGKRWRFAVPLAFGIGRGYNTNTRNNIVISEIKPRVLPLELSLLASYKLKWWLWLGAGMGTRVSLNYASYYNGPFYSIGIQLKTGAIYRKIKESIKK